jgi:outer membrane murein-binding lipoprotein Lpp
MPYFTPDQWVIVGLVFLLGLVIGMALMAGGKWKRRYREERARADELEAENKRLHKDAAEMDTLRHAAARDEARRRPDEPGPLA